MLQNPNFTCPVCFKQMSYFHYMNVHMNENCSYKKSKDHPVIKEITDTTTNLGERFMNHKEPNTANSKQYGGNHYKKFEIEPWDFIAKNNIPYLEGCAIKYLCRWEDKGGIEDLNKAIHFIEKVKELHLEKVREEERIKETGNNSGIQNIEADPNNF